MLKLEPTEAERVLLALPSPDTTTLIQLAKELDTLVRCDGDEAAQKQADALILRHGIGLTEGDCQLLRMAAEALRHRRHSRSVAD
jgi:hypothetical protein